MKDVLVFTNGCFDLIHPGHVDLLNKAKALGTKLVVGINSDRSVKQIKGPGRPILDEIARKEILLSLKSVDEVLIFDDPTPERIIREVKPNILVKGGDWKPDEIIGADFVLQNGGKVYSLPLKGSYSTTLIIERIRKSMLDQNEPNHEYGIVKTVTAKSLEQHIEVFKELLSGQLEQIEKCAALIADSIKSGGKVLICGNGGSAADAQHIAAEFVGRYEKERIPLPAIALTTDTSALTALSNDYGFVEVFSRQVEALATDKDVLIAISTSGDSENVIQAVLTARRKGCKTIGLTGQNGKKLAGLCDMAILVPSARTSRIQEAHITIGHIWCEIIDTEYATNR